MPQYRQLFQDAERQQALADALTARSMQSRAPQQHGALASKMHWGAGLAQLGEALIARKMSERARGSYGKADEAYKKAQADALQGLISGEQMGAGGMGPPQQLHPLEAAQGAIDSGIDPSVIGMAMQGPPDPIKVGQGESLVDPRTMQSVFQGEPKDERTTLQKQYEQAVQQGFEGSIFDYQAALKKAGASSVTVNSRNEGPIPSGFRAERDEQGNVIEYIPIKGGPAAQDAAAADAQAAEQARLDETKSDVVLQDIDRSFALLDDDSNIVPETGAIGSIAKEVYGTDAHALDRLLNTIRGNVGFDRLQQMREASPTGGALGAINKVELFTLQSVLGDLSQSQQDNDLKYNLGRLKNIYLDIVHGTDPETGAPLGPERVDLSQYQRKPQSKSTAQQNRTKTGVTWSVSEE